MLYFFFFKQKTAYEMRISDWSSDVCSSDLSAMLEVTSQDAADGSRTYVVRGQVFFASAVQFANSFDYLHASRQVLIDLTQAHFWDTSAVAALDRVVLKLRKHGASVDVIGLNRASESLVEQLGTHREEGAGLGVGH